MDFTSLNYEVPGKVAIVTGSTRGIGRAIVEAFADGGTKVVITGRTQSACDQVVAELEAKGYEALGVVTDVNKAEDRENLLKATIERFGRVDILVNNAGIGGSPKKLIDVDEAYFDDHFDTDVKSLYFMSQLVVRQMKQQGAPEGAHPYRIINLASVACMKCPVGDTVYGACKAAVAHLSRIMANELARFGITVNAVAPGYVMTDMNTKNMADEKTTAVVKRMITLRRYADPMEVASVVRFLASPASSYMTGAVIPIDGGMALN